MPEGMLIKQFWRKKKKIENFNENDKQFQSMSVLFSKIQPVGW
jgi:hypothetical protein